MSSHNVDPDFQQGTQNAERISLLFSKGKFASSIANEGGGINQLVLLFTILTGSPKKSVICLEEPEIHLHPAKQSQLMKTILKIVQEDEKQIILTTHSEYVLYPLLAAVSSGNLKPEDLSIYYFQYDDKNNKTLAEKLEVNDKGQLKGGLKGFWEATVSAMSEFIDEEK
jgi:predicted ATPase